MKKYEQFDISGDVGLKIFGQTLNDIFTNAAMGMYSLITDTGKIKEKRTIEIAVQSTSLESLFVSWLNELIFNFDTYGFIGKRVVITETTPSLILPPRGGGLGGGEINEFPNTQTYMLKATISGEDFDSTRHESRLLIKAATYHKLRLEKIKDTWEAEVIFDI